VLLHSLQSLGFDWALWTEIQPAVQRAGRLCFYYCSNRLDRGAARRSIVSARYPYHPFAFHVEIYELGCEVWVHEMTMLHHSLLGGGVVFVTVHAEVKGPSAGHPVTHNSVAVGHVSWRYNNVPLTQMIYGVLLHVRAPRTQLALVDLKSILV